MRSVLFYILLLIPFLSIAQDYNNKDLAIADSLYSAGNFNLAIRLYDKQLVELEQKDSTHTSNFIHSLAYKIHCLGLSGQYLEAQTLGEQTIDKLESINNPDLLELGEFYLAVGEIARNYSSDFQLAKKTYKKAIECFSKTENGLQKETTSYNHLGSIYTRSSSYDSADFYFKKALIGTRKLFGEKNFRVGGIYGQIAYKDVQQGKYWQALSNVKEMLTISVWEVDSTLITSRTYNKVDSLTSFYNNLFSLAETDSILTRIHPIDFQIFSVAMHSFFRLGNLRMAEKIAKECEPVFESSKQHLFTIDCQNMLANIYSDRHQYKYALSIYRKIKDEYRNLGMEETDLTSILFHNMAITFQKLGVPDSSSHYNLKALSIRKKIYPPQDSQIGESYFGIAMDHKEKNHLDSTRTYLELAFSSKYHTPAFINYERAILAIEEKRFAEAYNFAHTVLKDLEESSAFQHTLTLIILAELSQKLNQADSAIFYFNKALEVSYGDEVEVHDVLQSGNLEAINDPISFFTALQKKAQFLFEEYQTHQKLDYLNDAIEITELGKKVLTNLRASFILEDDNLIFAETVNDFIKLCVAMNIAMFENSLNKEYLYAAFKYADLNKAQVLLEAVKSSIVEKEENNSYLVQWSQLKKDIRSQRARIKDLEVTQSIKTSEISLSKLELQNLENQYEGLLKELKENHQGIFFYLSEELREFPIKRFMNHLGKTNTVVIQYFLGTDNIYRFILDSDDITYQVLSNSDSLKTSVSSLVNFVSSNNHPDSAEYNEFVNNSTYLNDQLFELNKVKESNENVVIIADGYLNKLPFEVLLSKEVESSQINFKQLPYIIKKWNISYAFSASLFFENTLSQSTSFSTKNSYGWAPFSDELTLNQAQKEVLRNNTLEKLIGSTEEIQSIVQKFKGRTFLSDEASEGKFKELTGKSSISHIATHGVVNTVYPELSYLLFSKNESDTLNDGYLYLYELYDLPLQNDLTILSACNTGTGDITIGEGVMSMARGFAYAGSKSVMMSLWLANDNSTSQIIQRFYSHLANKDTKSEALRKSKLEYLESANNLSSHPFYWAHIISTGNNEPLVQSRITVNTKLLIALFSILLIILLIRRRRS